MSTTDEKYLTVEELQEIIDILNKLNSVSFYNVTTYAYLSLQDSNGDNIGGITNTIDGDFHYYPGLSWELDEDDPGVVE